MTGVARALLPALAPCLAGAVAFALYLVTLLRRAAALRIPAYDTAFFEQVVWNVGHGNGWSSGYLDAGFLGLHFEPLLLLPALLERLGAGWQVLLVLESAGLAASGPAAFLFLRSLLGGRPSAALTAAALATPVPFWILLQNAADASYHTETLGLPLVLLAGWLGLGGRWPFVWGALALALAAKEDQAYTTLVVGLVLLRYGPSRLGAALVCAVSVAWAGGLELWVMPHLLPGGRSDLASYYAWLLRPTAAAVLGHLARPAGWVAVGVAVLGMAALPLLRPAWLLLTFPPFLGSLLSDHWPQPALDLQYGLPVVVPLLVAGGLGAARLLDLERPFVRRPASRSLLAALALPALVLGVALGPMPGYARPAGRPLSRQLASCAAAVPARAPVATDDDVAIWVAARPQEMPLTDEQPEDWLVIDTRRAPPGYVDQAARSRMLRRLPRSGRVLACSTGRFQVWTPVHLLYPNPPSVDRWPGFWGPGSTSVDRWRCSSPCGL